MNSNLQIGWMKMKKNKQFYYVTFQISHMLDFEHHALSRLLRDWKTDVKQLEMNLFSGWMITTKEQMIKMKMRIATEPNLGPKLAERFAYDFLLTVEEADEMKSIYGTGDIDMYVSGIDTFMFRDSVVSANALFFINFKPETPIVQAYHKLPSGLLKYFDRKGYVLKSDLQSITDWMDEDE